MFAILDNINGTRIECETNEAFKLNIKNLIENYTSMGLGATTDIMGNTAIVRRFKIEDLKETLVFYDCDCPIENFDDWFYAVFMVDNVEKAQKLFNCWFEEYIRSSELMEKTDRYQHIYRKARQYGYIAVNPHGYYGGFGV